MRGSSYIANAVGILALGVLAGVVAWLVAVVYGASYGIWSWCLGYPALAIIAVFVWRSEIWPHDPSDALLFAVYGAVVGATFFGIDVLLGTYWAPNLLIRYAIWQSGGPFGIVLTIAVCPGWTLVALAGAARELLLAESQPPVPPQKGKYIFLKLGR